MRIIDKDRNKTVQAKKLIKVCIRKSVQLATKGCSRQVDTGIDSYSHVFWHACMHLTVELLSLFNIVSQIEYF